jgi:hypothetical protein
VAGLVATLEHEGEPDSVLAHHEESGRSERLRTLTAMRSRRRSTRSTHRPCRRGWQDWYGLFSDDLRFETGTYNIDLAKRDGRWTVTRWYIECDELLGMSEMPQGFPEDELRLTLDPRATVQ